MSWRRVVLSLVLVSAGVWCMVLVAQAAETAATKPAAKPFEPAAPVAALMHGQDLHFKAIRKAIDAGDARSLRGAVQDAWLLAELANVNSYHNAAEDYRKFCADMKAASIDLTKSARARNVEACKASVGKIEAACNACHDKYK